MRGTTNDVQQATTEWAAGRMAQRIRELTAERDKAATMLGEEILAHERTRRERDELDAALKTTGERGWYVEYKQLLERVKELDAQAAQARLAQVGEYARYYHRVESKKALFPRDAAPLSFVEWYAKGEK